jgi:transcription-repair coupling factor (superfamily II helicase)
VQNLLDAALLKVCANDIGVSRIKQVGRNVVLSFMPTASADPLKIADIVKKKKGKLTFTVSPPTLVYKLTADEDEGFLTELREIVKQL